MTLGGPVSLGRLFIANRGEIVARIASTARALGLYIVAVYTEADAASPHSQAADFAVRVHSYLDIESLVAAALRSNADAVHPGYGFLAENADFARAVIDAGITWVGPPPAAIEAMADKAAAKSRMEAAGVPVLPGVLLPDEAAADVVSESATQVGLPLLVKAVAGGGGRGLRRVDSADRLEAEIEIARSEALTAFGDGRLMLERLVEGARHVEVQILADANGRVMHLGERDCTIQRRHQKILEESPSPPLEADPELRRRMCGAALAAAREVDYVGVGTVEMLLEPDGSFYFLEMNTRLQVEHPVTELRYGLDLVAWQLRVADGHPLPAELSRRSPEGHAIEARVYAEDPARGFAPSPGTVLQFREPRDVPGIVRVDHALADGVPIPPDYDPMLAKVVVRGQDRGDALRKLDRALGELVVFGATTNVAFLRHVLRHPSVVADADVDTAFVERELGDWTAPQPSSGVVALAAILLSERDGDASAGDLWGWRSAAGTEGWPMRMCVGFDREPAEVELTPRGPGRCDGRASYRAAYRGEVLEIELALRDASGGRLRVDGQELEVRWAHHGPDLWIRDGQGHHLFCRPVRGASVERIDDPTRVVAGMTGKVKAIRVSEGEAIKAGDCLLVLEAMKLETRVEAAMNGEVEEIRVAEGDLVTHRQLLMRLAELDPA
ncbi:MAG: ATP-grasp domain-containing protein [Thermoanaerobaculia bacterium]|nr:ATP-grasp domain-containing protein [Thermoanaerobaculia bacterium]